MVLNKIEKLLEKYHNAETSLEEEAQLKAYFLSDDVAPHLEHYKPLFNYFSQSKTEEFTKDVPLKTKKNLNIYKWISVAAIITLMLSIAIPQLLQKPSQEEIDRQLALETYEKTKEVFALISAGMDVGKDQLSTPLSQVTQKLEVSKSNALHLNQFNLATNNIFKDN